MIDVKIMLYIVIVAFFIAIVVLYFIHRMIRTKIKNDYEQEISYLEKQLIEAKQHTKAQEYMQLQAMLQGELKEAKKRVLEKTKSLMERDQMLKEAYRAILHYDQWTLCQSIINHQLNGFFDRLNVQYPNLTETQRLLALLFLLKLDNDDIALIMNYQTISLPNTKLRLAHKMNLKSSTLLIPTLQSVLIVYE